MVTQRARIEEQPVADELFAKAFRVSPAAMVVSSLVDHRVIDVNDAAIALAARSRHELVGVTGGSLGMWIDPEQRQRLSEMFRENGEVRNFAARMRDGAGAVRDVIIAMERLEVRGEPCALTMLTDVTAQRTTERLLEESQSIGHVGSWTVDLRTGETRWSAEACRIAGKTASPRGYQDFLSRVHPDDRAFVAEERDRALRDGDGYALEYRVLRPDGQVRWVFSRCVIELDATGAPVRLVGSFQDITERHEAEMRLAASEERYRRIVEASAQGVMTIGAGHVITFANGRLAEMLDMTREGLVGRTLFELVPAEQHAAIASRRVRREADTYDLTLVTSTGERLVAEITATPLLDRHGKVEGVLAMVSDVTTRRQAEELRARLVAIVESSLDAIASYSIDGTVQTWNAASERMFGYAASEAIGANIAMLVPPDELQSHRESLAQVSGGGVVAVETTRRRKDGSDVDVMLTRSPIVDASGRVIAVSTIARDITEQKRLEASLRQAEEHLRHGQKMEAIGALAGGIAHDFNNVLSVVLSSATLIEDALDPHDPICEDARAIREAADRAATLTRQLLAFSRGQVLEPRVVSLGTVIGGMEKMLRRLLGERIELAISAGTTANVLIDPGQFEQVIMNLVVNARDAMPAGGELTIESAPVTLPEGAFVRVTVTDTGAGMDEETRERMFEPFFTTKAKGKGTGLGLSTVFGIVRQSGGFVRVDTALGKGTSIAIYVPRTDRAERRSHSTQVPLSMKAQGETILVVEDEELVRRLVQKLLRRQGYQVITAANAGEAMLIAEQKPAIDLLLTDVVMPIMNGRQLAERFRAMYPGLRILYMSGYHDDEVLHDMVDTSNMTYLQKPVPRELLVRRIRELLDRS